MSTAKIIEKDGPLSYVRRMGDWAQEGGNNTIIIMGTDRAKKGGPASVNDGLGHIKASGEGKKTGTIHMIAGRADKNGNPDFDKDNAFIYLTMRSNVDDNLGLSSVESSSNNVSGAIVKSDVMRLVFRKDLKISIQDGKNYIFLDGSKAVVKVGQAKISVDGSSVSVESNEVKVKCVTAKIDAASTDITGNVTVSGGVTAGSVSAPTIAASTSLSIAGKNYANHTHPLTITGVKAGPDTVPAKTLTPL